MQVPLRIASQHYELAPDMEELIRERVAWLERFYPGLLECSVVVEGPGRHHQQGGPLQVQLDLLVPGRRTLSISRQVGEEIGATLREVFDAAWRRLEDVARKQRDACKHDAQHTELRDERAGEEGRKKHPEHVKLDDDYRRG